MHFHTLVLLMIFYLEEYTSEKAEFRPVPYRGLTPMVWIDGRNREPGTLIDTFYDRAVIIYLKIKKTRRKSAVNEHETTGVFITVNLVLTAFNPFEALSRFDETKERITISFLQSRLFLAEGGLKSYYVKHRHVICARPVIPLRELEPFPDHMKHGQHRPIHDLMVLRINSTLELYLPFGEAPEPIYEFVDTDAGGPPTWDNFNKAYHIPFGGIITEIAEETDELEHPLRFASMGHIDDAHISEGRYLEREELRPEDNVIGDCDKVLPREWGRFICIRNIYNYSGLASGALLFTGDKLIGMGSFAMWKGRNGFLIFTDLRPYRELLFKTCTENDQNLVNDD